MQTAIFLSILLSFAASEFLGVFTGGLITSGYLAFYLEQPLRLALTHAAAILTWGVVRLLASRVLIFGRRRYMAAILLGYVAGWALGQVFGLFRAIPYDMRVIGYIVPGLLANDMLRQGVTRTVLMSLLATGIIRLVLMLGGLG